MGNKTGILRQACDFLCHPSTRIPVLAIALASLLTGVILWGGFNTFMEATNDLEFCISCHEMRDNVYTEYKKTLHYSNRVGVRAICSDCHVPKSWGHKLMRKIAATRELYDKVIGHVDTPEKFEEHRMEMASREWARMKASDSRECRNCHSFDAMRKQVDKLPVYKKHMEAKENGKTCIDCHKGIAHLLPREYENYGEDNQ
jgi:cytochrome c-type protein NapC